MEIRHSRLGSSAQSIPELFDDEKTVVSIASEPTGKGDGGPPLLIQPTSFSRFSSAGPNAASTFSATISVRRTEDGKQTIANLERDDI